MDKLYSKIALTTKTISCLLLVPLFFALASAMNDDLLLVKFVISAVVVGCVYTIPFWMSLSVIKKYRVNKIKKYIVNDFLFCYVPAVLGSLITEVVDSIIRSSIEMAGFITLVFMIILLVISAVFWLLYFLYSYKE